MTTEQIDKFLDEHSFTLEGKPNQLALYLVRGNNWYRMAIVSNQTEAYQEAEKIVQRKKSLKLYA